MQQRQPRLGDILDDYCPRERRVTNHAVVAMIDQEVKQTRCTTCDAEHEYKNARVPARKKKSGPATPFEEVLAGMPRKPTSAASAPAEPDRMEPDVERERPAVIVPAPVSAAPVEQADVPPPPAEDEPRAAAPDADGPVHRPLIRATLPRIEGQVKERPIPEFTVRAATNARSGRFRPHGGGGGQGGGQGQGGRRGQGQGPAGGPPGGFRFGRRGPGQGQFAAAGAPAHGKHSPQGDRQGGRRRGGKKRAK